MKKIALLLGVLLFSNHLNAVDVFGTSAYFVKVSENSTKTMVKFELCSLINQNSCNAIGNKNFYSKKKLQNLRNSEKWDVLTSTAADIAIILGTAFTGGALAYTTLVASATDGAIIYGTMGGTIAGGTVGGMVPAIADALNPYEQYKQLETLDSEVLNDKKVVLNYSVEDFAKRLGAVLDNIH